jgi:hypothetical protein
MDTPLASTLGNLSLNDRPNGSTDTTTAIADLVKRCKVLNEEVGQYVTAVFEQHSLPGVAKVERPVEHRSLRTVSDSIL